MTTVTGTLTINGVAVPFTGTIPTPPTGATGPAGPTGATGPAGPAGSGPIVPPVIPPVTPPVSVATIVFDYSSGFTSATSTIGTSAIAKFSGSMIELMPAGSGHAAGAAWYLTKQPTGPFTTTFAFQLPSMSSIPLTAGLTFCIQDTQSPPGASGFVGRYFVGDANCGGYGSYNPANYGSQYPCINSVAVAFNANSMQFTGYPAAGAPSYTGLYTNGGPFNALTPANDMVPYGINLYSGHVFEGTIVYDGVLLTLVIEDATTGAQCRQSWPLNLANVIPSGSAFFGFTAGTAGTGPEGINLLSWKHSTGINTRLATPTFSPAPGEYAGAQSVTISGSGTIYYTTNGLLPTSASSKYAGPVAVGVNEVIQAVAIQAAFTDSLVGVGAYQIGTANVINLPSGFSANDGVVPVGYAYKNGSALVLTDNLTAYSSATNGQSGAAWFCDPVNIESGFSTTFQIAFNGTANGMCFVMQNTPAAYAAPSTAVSWPGGPNVIGGPESSLGYGGSQQANGWSAGILNSVAIAFDLFTVSNSVGLYTNGATPVGNQTPSGLTFNGGTFNVTIYYLNGTLSVSMQPAGGGTTFSHSWAVNIPSVVGANTATIGFTGATGGQMAVQQINSWTAS